MSATIFPCYMWHAKCGLPYSDMVADRARLKERGVVDHDDFRLVGELARAGGGPEDCYGFYEPPVRPDSPCHQQQCIRVCCAHLCT